MNKTADNSQIENANTPRKDYSSASAFAILGFFLAALGHCLPVLDDFNKYFLNSLSFIGMAMFFYGCYGTAKRKGYNGAWSLLGILAFPGFIVLLILPNRLTNHN